MNTAFYDELMSDPYLAAKLEGVMPRRIPGMPERTAPDEEDLYNQAPEAEPGAAPPIPASPTVREPTQPRKPGFLGRLKAAVPDMITSAIAGGATPNIAGGAPVDIFRAMQAGQNAVRSRDLMNYNMARQQQQDAMNQEHTAAQIRQADAASRAHDAQAGYYSAQANAKGAPNPEADLYNRWASETDPEKKQALFELLLRYRGHAPKEETLATVEARLMQEFQDPNTTPERRQQIREALTMRNPQRLTITRPGDSALGPDGKVVYSNPAASPRTTNPTEASIAMAAAAGDQTAKRALDLLTGARANTSNSVDQRQKRTRVAAAWESYKTALNNAEETFARMKAGLDKDQMGVYDSDYESKLRGLEDALVKQKQNAQGALETVLAEYEVPFTHYNYPHPSTQRRAPAPTPQAQPAPTPQAQPAAATPAPAAPEVLARAKTLVGKTVRLRDGRVVKIKSVDPDGTLLPE